MKCREYFWSRKSQCTKRNKGLIFCPIDQREINGNRKAKCLEVDVRALAHVDPTDAEGGAMSEERKARSVHVWKCQECSKEFRLSDQDVVLINEDKIAAPYCCGGYCCEDRIEIVDADGNVGTVIV